MRTATSSSKAYLDLEQLRAGYAAITQEVRDVLTGYVAGYNRYLRDHAASLPAACRGAAWVKAMSLDDMYLLIAEKALHATGEVFAGAIVAAAREPSAAVALARSIAPATRKIPMGMPAVVIGFNKDMAWTHTVTKAVHFTTFKLDLDPADPSGTTYFYDGAPLKMTSRTVSIDSLQADGTLASKQKTFYFSKQGAVMVMPDAGVDWTASTTFVLGEPGAARAGWFRRCPQRVRLEPGSGLAAGIFGGANMPAQERQDYVANSNDAYWLGNARELLTGPAPYGYSPLYGSTDVEQTLRTRIGFKQLQGALAEERFLDTGDLQRLMFANRVHAAELILPEQLPACLASNDRQLLLACTVLMIWDRKADLDSRGAVLFREFRNVAAGIPDKWKVPFDAADPVNTPRGLAPAAKPAMLDALRAAVAKLNAQGVPLYGRLGDYQNEIRNGKRYPLHGGICDIDGSYNSINTVGDLDASGYSNVSWCTSYVGGL